jgi:hypothetical protein
MPPLNWHDEVWQRVIRCGLPPDYAERLVTELGEHAEDAGDPTVLGSPAVIAATAVSGYRSGRLAGRHPVLTQLVAPLLVALLGWIMCVNGSIWLVERIGGTYDPLSLTVAHLLVFVSRFAAPLLAVTGLWWIHRRSGRPRWWFAAGGAIIALLAAMYSIDFTPPSQAIDHEPEVIVEFTHPSSWWAVVQVAAVVVPVMLVARLDRARSLAMS